MALGKILNLGGIDNRPPKANQSPGRFRVARNVMPTPDGRLIPRYDCNDAAVNPTDIPAYQAIANYDGEPLAVVSSDYTLGNDVINCYKSGVAIPKNFYEPDTEVSTSLYRPTTPTSTLTTRVKNTVYALSSVQGQFIKYDGVEVSKCGVTVPQILTTSYTSTGTKYIKVIKHCLDFDQNELWSESVTFPMLTATTSLNLQLGQALAPAVAMPQDKYILNVSPSTIRSDRWGSDVNFFKGTTTYNAISQSFVVTCSAQDTSINNVSQIGSYVFVKTTSFTANTYIQLPKTETALALALKVKKVYSSGTIELDIWNPKYLDSNRQWQDTAILVGNLATLASTITVGCREIISVWASPSATGIYWYYGNYPYVPPTASNTAYTVTIPNPPNSTNYSSTWSESVINLNPYLNEFYDINTVKVSPNSWIASSQEDIFGARFPKFFTSMTTYQGLLLLANDDIIYFSDPTFEGSFEQLETGSFRVIGNKEDGIITSICGTNDFLIVCRERKIYYVNGDIVTGNARIQEIENANIGAWSNSSSLVVKDTVIVATATGIFQISDGGRCVELSERCAKNFNTLDANSVNEDVSFKISGVNSWYSIPYNSYEGLAIAHDPYRELVVFMQRKLGNPCLVLHTKTGEFYEWNGLISDSTMYANCLQFIDGKLYIGTINTDIDFSVSKTYTAKMLIENKDNTASLNYVSEYPIKLYTSWLTGGEPSLEKILLQFKMFGRIQSESDSSSINVSHYKDWNINDKITNSPYFPSNTSLPLDSQTQYSHKKRFNSDKLLSASVGFEVSSPGVTFELESIEVEFSSIQEGMKR